MDALIGELLHQHECVIVPGLGGFLTNYSPARIHPVHHVFVPPSRYIVFNASLSYNDGILANHLSSLKNISFREAMDIIVQWVNEHQYQLKNGHNWPIGNIGSLSLDREENLQFEPSNKVNYLMESYGLTSIVSPPIKRLDFDLGVASAKRSRNLPPLTQGLKWAAAIIPFAGVALWGTLYSHDINLFYASYSSLMPWENATGNIRPVAESIKSSGMVFTEFNKVNSSILADRSGKIALNQEVPNLTMIQTVPAGGIQSESKESSDAISAKYHIIGGAFRIFENAGNYVDALKRKGYSASIVDKNRHGLFVVSISGFRDKNAATAQLALIRSSENPEAWLMMR
ncbi:MAG: SPOR domain-containing protein [Bacteroidota bacterium]